MFESLYLEPTQTWFTKNMPEHPDPPAEEYPTVLQEMAWRNPKAAAMNLTELVAPRFVKELEDSGFVAGLPKK
jgi:hypothetical protein